MLISLWECLGCLQRLNSRTAISVSCCSTIYYACYMGRTQESVVLQAGCNIESETMGKLLEMFLLSKYVNVNVECWDSVCSSQLGNMKMIA